jgi:hypothetical protein
MKQNPVSQLVLASTTSCFSREKHFTGDGKTSGSVLGQRLSIIRRACRLASIALGIYSQNRITGLQFHRLSLFQLVAMSFSRTWKIGA